VSTERELFVSLDGPDGAGKSTQVARLVSWLRETGREVVTCRDPGGTPLGDRLRGILLDRHETEPCVRAEMLLYMASRAQLVEAVIRPALDRGAIVVCDRYLLANVVYQGFASGLAVEDVWRVGEVATGGLMPDLTIVLDLDPDIAASRVGRPRDRMEDRPREFQMRVREAYHQAAQSYRWPIVFQDASETIEVVAAAIRREVEHALEHRPRS
jgi:dTMP kinase